MGHPVISRRGKRERVQDALQAATEIKLILGASNTEWPGWIATGVEVLDITKPSDWTRVLRGRRARALIAEHVVEHLSEKEFANAAKLAFDHLEDGGYWRIAVPDGLHPSKKYRECVRPGGTGAGSDDHKQLLDYRSIQTALRATGFEVVPLEWFDENGQFHRKEWLPDDGFVLRSSEFDDRNLGRPLSYTSLIIDALKK